MTRISIEELTELVRRQAGGADRGSFAPGGSGDPEDPFARLWEYRDPRRHTAEGGHRRRTAWVARTAKRLFRGVMRPFLHDTLETQTRFNEAAIAAFDQLQRATAEIAALRRANAELAARLDARGPGGSVFRFRGCHRVVDLGCGGGAFLERLREQGIPAYGVDRDEQTVRACRAAGFEVVQADALAHLEDLDPRSVDGLFAGRHVEHRDRDELMRFLRAAWRVLEEGGVLVLETANAASAAPPASMDHAEHRRPDTVRDLAESCGFRECELLGVPAGFAIVARKGERAA